MPIKKKFIYLHSQNKGKDISFDCSFHCKITGPVVQLVRIHACHAWGREFESRPDRQHF